MPGRDTDYLLWTEKQLELECELTDKGVLSMADGRDGVGLMDDDLGLNVPAKAASAVKEEVSEDLEELKDLPKDLGKT